MYLRLEKHDIEKRLNDGMASHNLEKSQMIQSGQKHPLQRGQTFKKKKEILQLAVEDSDDNTDENSGSGDSLEMMKSEQKSGGSSDGEKTGEIGEQAFMKQLGRIGVRRKSQMMIVQGRKLSTPLMKTGGHKLSR